MTTKTTPAYVPDALDTLRDSFTLHLDATRKLKTSVIYLSAPDALIAHLKAQGAVDARSVRRKHVESFVAARREKVKPTTQSSLDFSRTDQSLLPEPNRSLRPVDERDARWDAGETIAEISPCAYRSSRRSTEPRRPGVGAF